MSDPQEIWTDYYSRIKARRMAEAALLWREVERAEGHEYEFAMDFTHFSNDREGAEKLASQLSENYDVQIAAASRDGYWDVKGTTRPQVVDLSSEQHLAWIEFMSDVAQSYACVFSNWTLEALPTRSKFESSHFEVE